MTDEERKDLDQVLRLAIAVMGLFGGTALLSISIAIAFNINNLASLHRGSSWNLGLRSGLRGFLDQRTLSVGSDGDR